jgi:hypothetical protein
MKRARRVMVASLLMLSVVPCDAGLGDDAVCTALLEDERAQMADYELEVELAQSKLAAFEKIYELIDSLRKQEAIEKMTWLKAQHDRDAARLGLERARLILARQQSHIERIRLGCAAPDGDRARKIREAHRSYLEADCDQMAKAIEVAQVSLEFNREWLASIRELREGSTATATAQDVILAELDVKLEEQRLADARARTDACRKRMASKP